MNRRTFVKSASAAAVAATLVRPGDAFTTAPDTSVRRVLIIFKCHLDVGFTDTQANVMRTYFTDYYPRAISLAAASREAGKNRYVWSTGAWLLFEYLEQASTSERRRMEEAVAHGDIAWHALPFSWQTEMLDRSMIEGCLGLSQSLDQRFGTKTIAGKMTDVPGHSRGIVAPLAKYGVQLLDIGVNPASTFPEVPDVFVWREPEGAELMVVYHKRDYGSVIRIPGTDLAIDVEVRTDNSGPHTPDEIANIYARLRRQFPQATLTATNLSRIATEVAAFKNELPVVTGEIGDTWIYGAPSDPPKVAHFREAARLRREWLAAGTLSIGDETDRALLRRLALAAEHTWGTDTKRYIDHDHYAPADLAKYLDAPNYQIMERSWQEKRDDIDAGINELPPGLRSQAQNRLRSLTASAPDMEGFLSASPDHPIRTTHFEIGFDAKTGAINRLMSRDEHVWATPESPLALFAYQTLNAADYASFLSRYVRSKEWWAPQDFGKPNIDRLSAESRLWHPTLKRLSQCEDAQTHRILAQMAIEDSASEQRGLVAWPAAIYLELRLPKDKPIVDMRLVCLRKAANRMPEAMWFSFQPASKNGRWVIEKVNQRIDPSEVLRGGGRSMHAVTEKLWFHQGRQTLEIATLDAPVVAFGALSPLNFSQSLPDFSGGAHICLFNNAWGTNYPQWAGGDWGYRFVLKTAAT